ncbi:HEXXH motif domain-containing protein [Streptosporangium sp. NPDC051023]|uniref:HEXXH motif domain-containing protein n=1 Tax=Streptosporangium sp. NPDC051023 TaxID=3155410 RepID=UPI00344F0BA2
MKLVPRAMSQETFFGVAAGGGGAGAVGELRAAQALKNRLLVRGVVVEARLTGHAHADLAERAYGLLAEMERHAADEVQRVLVYPAVGAWAWRAYRSLMGHAAKAIRGDAGDAVRGTAGGTAGHMAEGVGRGGGKGGGKDTAVEDPGRLGALALAVAIRSGVACAVQLPVSDGTIMLPSLGRVTLPDVRGVVDVGVRPDGDGARLDVAGTRLRVSASDEVDGDGWEPLHRLPAPAGEGLVIDDLDPYRWPAAHASPVYEGVEPRLTDEQRRVWRVCMRDAWQVLGAHHRTVAEEVISGIRVFTPITAPARGENSASSRETFGAVALSEPRNGLRLAATLAHEMQHAKLTALIDQVELTLPEAGGRHYAPWRDDPRPVYGLLQGSYAYLGVARFWGRQRRVERGEPAFRAEVEFARWREGAYLVSETLMNSGGLNERGERFVREMRRTLERLLSEPVGRAAAAQARLEADQHLEAWVRRNP